MTIEKLPDILSRRDRERLAFLLEGILDERSSRTDAALNLYQAWILVAQHAPHWADVLKAASEAIHRALGDESRSRVESVIESLDALDRIRGGSVEAEVVP